MFVLVTCLCLAFSDADNEFDFVLMTSAYSPYFRNSCKHHLALLWRIRAEGGGSVGHNFKWGDTYREHFITVDPYIGLTSWKLMQYLGLRWWLRCARYVSPIWNYVPHCRPPILQCIFLELALIRNTCTVLPSPTLMSRDPELSRRALRTYAQNPLHTFPRNFPVDGEAANLLRTC